MPAIEKRTISLPSEQAAFVDAKVNSGDYASVSEVVRAGLRALHEQETAVERWLQTEVAATFDAMQDNPASAIPADEVFASLRTRHAQRSAQNGE